MLGLATSLCGCVLAPETNSSEPLYERVVEGNVFDTAPVRGELRPLRHRRTGFEYRCTECHNDFESPRRQNELQAEHAEVDKVFDHGMNLYCLNCHHPTDRNNYVDHDGSIIPADEPARLCAKCHGPTYQEWVRGTHGRQNGYWDRSRGERTKLYCIQCHDPHHPTFAPMKPEPAPIRSRLEQHVGQRETEAGKAHEEVQHGG